MPFIEDQLPYDPTIKVTTIDYHYRGGWVAYYTPATELNMTFTELISYAEGVWK